jgi:hypothetical protein
MKKKNTFASDWKCVANILGSHFVKAFSALSSHYLMSAASQKLPLILVEGHVKITFSQVRRVWGMLQCCHIALSLRNP